MSDAIRSVILRIAAVFAVLSIICLFITEKGSASFWVSVMSLVVCVIIIVLWVITARINYNKEKDKSKDKEKEEHEE